MPRPEIKVVNHTGSPWLGRCIWALSATNTTIEIQLDVCADEKTLHRVVAHELCHHEDYLKNWAAMLPPKPEKLDTTQQRPSTELWAHEEALRSYLSAAKTIQRRLHHEAHGKGWQEVANRFNAKFGEKYVTERSDHEYVRTAPNKAILVLMRKWPTHKPDNPNYFIWQWATRLGPAAQKRLEKYWKTNADFKLVKTNNPVLLKDLSGVARIGDNGYTREKPETHEALQELWNNAPDLSKQAKQAAASQLTIRWSPTEYTDRDMAEGFTPEGRSVGKVDVLFGAENRLPEGVAQTEAVEIWPEYQRKGYGLELYRAVFEALKKRGFREVRSSSMRMEGGEGVWKALRREYPVVEGKDERGLHQYRLKLAKQTKTAVLKSQYVTEEGESPSGTMWVYRGTSLQELKNVLAGKGKGELSAYWTEDFNYASEFTTGYAGGGEGAVMVAEQPVAKPPEKARNLIPDPEHVMALLEPFTGRILWERSTGFKDKNWEERMKTAGPQAPDRKQHTNHQVDNITKTDPAHPFKEARSFKNAIVMASVSGDAAIKVMQAAALIPDEELGKDGREDDPHITIKFGVKDDPELLKNTLKGVTPFSVTLGKLKVFIPSESSGGQAPVVAEAIATQLKVLHDKVDAVMSARPDDFPYSPHVTLAYVKPEIAKKYEGSSMVAGLSFVVDHVVLSRADRTKLEVPFEQAKAVHAGSAEHKFVKEPRVAKDYVLVAVDPQKFDQSWQQDRGFYVGPGGTDSAIRGRYERFQNWLKDNPSTPIEAPIVSWNPVTDSVSFTNGRHRFAVLRDMGARKVYLAVPNDQVGIFQKFAKDFGYSKHNEEQAKKLDQISIEILHLYGREVPYENPDSGTHTLVPYKVVAQYDAKGLVGVVGVSIQNGRDAVVNLADIKDEWRGTGLGQMLYDAAIQEAERLGCENFYSDTSLSDDGRRAWERLSKRYHVLRTQGRFRINLRYKEGPPDFKVEGSHKTPPLSDTQYQDQPGLDGEGSNAYADVRERVQGTEQELPLEELNPALFKQGVRSRYGSADLFHYELKQALGQLTPEEDDFPKVLYHGTTPQSAQAIMREGFKKSSVWWTSDPKVAAYYGKLRAREEKVDKFAILKVDALKAGFRPINLRLVNKENGGIATSYWQIPTEAFIGYDTYPVTPDEPGKPFRLNGAGRKPTAEEIEMAAEMDSAEAKEFLGRIRSGEYDESVEERDREYDEWLKNNKDPEEPQFISPEEDPDGKYAGEAYKLAEKGGIHILRDKEPHTYILSNGKVIGALFVSEGQDAFSFDIVIAPKWQGVGLAGELIDIAEDEFDQRKAAFGDDYKIQLDVVNPRMKAILEGRGYAVEQEQGNRWQMTKQAAKKQRPIRDLQDEMMVYMDSRGWYNSTEGANMVPVYVPNEGDSDPRVFLFVDEWEVHILDREHPHPDYGPQDRKVASGKDLASLKQWVESWTAKNKTAKGMTIGEVYLLHFDTPYRHARHYLGWAENAETRIEQHRQGTAARLTQVIKDHGIGFQVARIWPDKERGFERQLKNQGGLSRHCPICHELGIDRDTLRKKHLEEKMQEVEVVPPQPTVGPDFVEVRTAASENYAYTLTELPEAHGVYGLVCAFSKGAKTEHAKELHQSLRWVDSTTYEKIPAGFGPENLIGWAFIMPLGKGEYEVSNVFVDPDFRRKGVATGMYDYFEQNVGPLRPNNLQTSEGRAFWQSRGAAKTGAQEVYYHSTLTKNLNNIATQGLTPQTESNWGGELGDFSRGKILLGTTYKQAMFYALQLLHSHLEHNQVVSVPVCLRVRLTGQQVIVDKESFEGDVWTMETIPPQNIEVWWQGSWQPLKPGEWDDVQYVLREGEWYDWEGEIVGDNALSVEDDVRKFTYPKTAGVRKIPTIEYPRWIETPSGAQIGSRGEYHLSMAERLGLPTHGLAFDQLRRGVAEVNHADKTVTVRGYRDEWPSNEVVDAFRARYPKYEIKEQALAMAGPEGGRTVNFVRNPQGAPNFESRFGQDVEPAGRYISEVPEGTTPPKGWYGGKIHFKNPLVVDWGEDYQSGDNWKHRLSKRYGGKTGEALSEAIRKDGYDGIITVNPDGSTSEIVDLGPDRYVVEDAPDPNKTATHGVATLLSRLEALRPRLAAAAQAVYNNENIEEYGGICAEIAVAFKKIIGQRIKGLTLRLNKDDMHTWLEVSQGEEHYRVDIPWQFYEEEDGSGFILHDNVKFKPSWLRIKPVHDPYWEDYPVDFEKDAASGGGLGEELFTLRPQIAAAAQKVYDENVAANVEDPDMEHGICDEIAQEIQGIIVSSIDGVEVTEGGQEGDDHAWVIAYRGQEVYGVDISPSVYESGAGYSWKLHKDVKIDPSDVEVWPLDIKPEDLRIASKTAAMSAPQGFRWDVRKDNNRVGWTIRLFPQDSNKWAGHMEIVQPEGDILAGGNKKEKVFVFDVMVRPEYRGKGLGLALYEKAIEVARENGYQWLLAGTYTSPDAKRVWESLRKKYHVENDKTFATGFSPATHALKISYVQLPAKWKKKFNWEPAGTPLGDNLSYWLLPDGSTIHGGWAYPHAQIADDVLGREMDEAEGIEKFAKKYHAIRLASASSAMIFEEPTDAQWRVLATQCRKFGEFYFDLGFNGGGSYASSPGELRRKYEELKSAPSLGKEAAAPSWLYHVTYSGYLDRINAEGLQPGIEPGITGHGSGKGKVFVTEDPQRWLPFALNWAQHRYDHLAEENMIPVVLRFPRQDAKDLKEDEHGGRGDYSTDSVPPDHLQLWDGKKWTNNLSIDPFASVDESGYLRYPEPLHEPKLAAKIPAANKFFLWAYKPDEGLRTIAEGGPMGATHVEWFEKMGLPSSGPMFDAWTRGTGRVMPDKTIRAHFSGATPADPNIAPEIIDALHQNFPGYQINMPGFGKFAAKPAVDAEDLELDENEQKLVNEEWTAQQAAPETRKLYHGTSSIYIDAVTTHGFRAGTYVTNDWYTAVQEAYGTTHEDVTGTKGVGGVPTVITLNTDEIKGPLKPDPEYIRGAIESREDVFAWKVVQPIPAAAIIKVEQRNYQSNAKAPNNPHTSLNPQNWVVAAQKPPLTKELLEKIAWEARDEIMGSREAIDGDCEPVSDTIVEKLRALGYKDAYTVYGQFEDKPQHPHAWVRVGDWEVDATQDQFARFQDDEKREAELAEHPVYVGKPRTQNYKGGRPWNRPEASVKKTALQIEVPKAVREHFWEEPPEGNLEFWAYRHPVNILPGEKIVFTFNGAPVARAVCHHTEAPGLSQCENTGKYKKHHKVYWDPKSFVRLDGKTAEYKPFDYLQFPEGWAFSPTGENPRPWFPDLGFAPTKEEAIRRHKEKTEKEFGGWEKPKRISLKKWRAAAPEVFYHVSDAAELPDGLSVNYEGLNRGQMGRTDRIYLSSDPGHAENFLMGDEGWLYEVRVPNRNLLEPDPEILPEERPGLPVEGQYEAVMYPQNIPPQYIKKLKRVTS